MADLHQVVVDDVRKVRVGEAIRLPHDEVVDRSGLELHVAADDVVERRRPLVRRAKAHDRFVARRATLLAFGGRQVAAVAIVARRLLAPLLLSADFCQPLRRAEALIRVTLLDELAGVSLVVLQPLGLDVRPVVAAGLRPFVPLQPQPAQAAEDRLQRPRIVARLVGVFDAQNEHAIRVARVEPVEQRRAEASDVRDAGGAGGEADADGHRGIV